METAVRSSRPCEDAVDNTSGANVVGRGCGREAEKGSGSKCDTYEADHIDCHHWLIKMQRRGLK
jgi:hypothetical protein